MFPENLEGGCMEKGIFELDLDGWVGFRSMRERGEHSRRKKLKEQRHRGGINQGRSRESGSLGGEGSGKRIQREFRKGLGPDHSPCLGGQLKIIDWVMNSSYIASLEPIVSSLMVYGSTWPAPPAAILGCPPLPL